MSHICDVFNMDESIFTLHFHSEANIQNQNVEYFIYSAFNEGGNTTTGYGAVNISRTLQLSLLIAERVIRGDNTCRVISSAVSRINRQLMIISLK
jgi:hypothetical protein